MMNLYPTSARSKIRRLATGRLISVTGGAAAYTALNYTVWERTRSPGMQALSLLLTFGVAGILGPLGGAIGDRFDRRKVMIWSELVSTLFFTAMVFAHEPIVLIVLAFGSAIADLPFFTASRAAIPNLVDDENDVSWANSLVTMGVHAGIAVGPLIGGVLVATGGASWVFGVNALTFVVSILLTLSVRGEYQQDREAHEVDEHQGLAAGAAFLWRDRVMRRMTLAWFVFVLGMGMGMVADAALAEHFDRGPVGFAALIACWGSGSVVGSGLGRYLTPRTEPVWLVAGSFGIAIAAFSVGFAPLFVLVLVSLFIMGAADGVTMVAETGIMQRRTPDAVRSRTMAAFESVLSLGLAAAYLMAGPVLKALGPQSTYRLGGLSALAAALLLLPMLKLRGDGDPGADAVHEQEQVFEREPLGDVVAGVPRYTSAEAMETERPAAGAPERRSA
ncbi:MAG TPA: MFS transporter [Actinomycetota bacterium]|nr:MFS transporter [Actinomycetota bacterium]